METKIIEFLQKTNTKMSIAFLKYGKHFANDTYSRNIYRVKLKRGTHSYTFQYGQSIAATQKNEVPSKSEILECLQLYDINSYEDFCANFGYEEYEAASKKIYRAVLREYAGVCHIWESEEINELIEIIQS